MSFEGNGEKGSKWIDYYFFFFFFFLLTYLARFKKLLMHDLFWI